MKNKIFLILCIFLNSCATFEFEKLDSVESNLLQTFVKLKFPNKSKTKDICFVYIKFKDCICVSENIEFLEFLARKNSNKQFLVFANILESYPNEKLKLESVGNNLKNITIKYDLNSEFSKSGNFYLTDKFFKIEKKTTYIVQLAKLNFSKIEALLNF